MPTITRKPITITAKRPITDTTRFTTTAEGLEALAEVERAAPPGTCPRCGDRLGVVSMHVGGRGSVPHDFCRNSRCDYWKRSA